MVCRSAAAAANNNVRFVWRCRFSLSGHFVVPSFPPPLSSTEANVEHMMKCATTWTKRRTEIVWWCAWYAPNARASHPDDYADVLGWMRFTISRALHQFQWIGAIVYGGHSIVYLLCVGCAKCIESEWFITSPFRWAYTMGPLDLSTVAVVEHDLYGEYFFTICFVQILSECLIQKNHHTHREQKRNTAA